MRGIEQDPSNFSLVEHLYRDIISDVRDRDATGQTSTRLCARRTYLLANDTKLFVTEHYTRTGKIDHFYYDWVSTGTPAKPILFFHSEAHADETYQTSTEPFHLHTFHKTKLTNVPRLPNHSYRDLLSVFEFIRTFIYASEALEDLS